MVPEVADRPDVLPSERLLANGMAVPALRKDLRHIDNVRNAVSVATVWFWVALIIGGRGLAGPVVGLCHRLRPHGPASTPASPS